jgi:hypothetical protein
MLKTIYLNLEDDIAKITSKIKREKAEEIVLVFPKKSFLFSDSINLRLLKKQLEPLGKTVSILTMDEMGQMYAKEAGFALKFLPKSPRPGQFSDIRRSSNVRPQAPAAQPSSSPEPTITKRPAIVADQRQGERRQTQRRSTPRRTIDRVQANAAAAEQVFHRDPDIRQQPRLMPRLEKPARPRAGRSWRKALIGFVALALIIIIALVVVVLPGADITVYAKSQTISRDIEMNLNTKTTTVDAASLTMPAVAVDQTLDASNTFQTLGKKEVGTKSAGRVAIYNLTGKPLNLKATTTVLSAGSKNYTFNEDQNGIHALPSSTQDQNATVADITAQGGGESYNLPAGTRLEITNQSFGSQPQRLYAKTVTQVVGGTSRFISVITQDDILRAQNELNKAALGSILSDLEPQHLTMIDGAYTATPAEFATDKPVDTETPSYNAKIKLRIQGLAFDQDKLVQLLRERLSLSLSGNQALQEADQDNVTIKVKGLDLTNGVLSLSIHYESKAIPQLDISGVRQQLSGKSKQEASEILLSNSDIERVDITLTPSWQTSIPRLTNKIRIDVQK